MRKEVTIAITIHDKVSQLQQKGASGAQLRYDIRARTIYYRYTVNAPEKEGMAEFEFQYTYKSQGGTHRIIGGIIRSKLIGLPLGMELSIVDTQGVNLGIFMWPIGMEDLLDSVMSMAADVAPSSALMY